MVWHYFEAKFGANGRIKQQKFLFNMSIKCNFTLTLRRSALFEFLISLARFHFKICIWLGHFEKYNSNRTQVNLYFFKCPNHMQSLPPITTSEIKPSQRNSEMKKYTSMQSHCNIKFNLHVEEKLLLFYSSVCTKFCLKIMPNHNLQREYLLPI